MNHADFMKFLKKKLRLHFLYPLKVDLFCLSTVRKDYCYLKTSEDTGKTSSADLHSESFIVSFESVHRMVPPIRNVGSPYLRDGRSGIHDQILSVADLVSISSLQFFPLPFVEQNVIFHQTYGSKEYWLCLYCGLIGFLEVLQYRCFGRENCIDFELL